MTVTAVTDSHLRFVIPSALVSRASSQGSAGVSVDVAEVWTPVSTFLTQVSHSRRRPETSEFRG